MFLLLIGCQIWLRLVGRLMHRVKKVKLEDETEGSWKRYDVMYFFLAGRVVSSNCSHWIIVRGIAQNQGQVFASTDPQK